MSTETFLLSRCFRLCWRVDYQKAFLESPEALVWIREDSGAIEDANEAACRLLGRDRVALQDLRLDDILSGSDPDLLPTLVKNGTDSREVTIRNHKGRLQLAEMKSRKLSGRAGCLVSLSPAYENLKETEALRKNAFMVNTTQDYMALISPEYRYEAANRSACNYHKKKPEEITAGTLQEIWGTETFFSALKPHIDQCLQGEYIYFQDWFPHGENGKKWMAISFSPYKDQTGLIKSVVMTGRDVTEKKLGEEEREYYLKTLALLNEAVIELDDCLEIRRVNEAWTKIMPLLKQGTTIGISILEFIEKGSVEPVRNRLSEILSGETEKASVRFRNNTDEEIWLEGTFIPQWQGGKISGLRGTIRDITLNYEHEKQIEYLAYHDNLTGLPNRFSLTDRLSLLVRSARETSGSFAVIFLDLDEFNQINDALGHRLGDLVLASLGQRFMQLLPEYCHCFRWAGDEFVILVEDTGNPNDRRQIMQILKSISSRPHQLDDVSLHVTFSGGMSVFPSDSGNPETLINQAHKAAMYGKKRLRNNIQTFASMPTDEKKTEELDMRNFLTRDIIEGNINVVYQPKISAGDGTIKGMEALARWEHSIMGKVSPAVFIPMAEQLGLIVGLGEQVMRKAFEYLASLKNAGFRLNLALNISQRQLFSTGFVSNLIRQVEECGIECEDVTLEITESVSILESERVMDRLRTLKYAGFQISLDDFGTGYSSLSHLHAMPVDELKIDQSFISHMDSENGFKLLNSICSMAKVLGMSSVAEGVATPEHAGKLIEMGVDVLQGFHFSRPLTESDFLEFLRRTGGKADMTGLGTGRKISS